MTRPGRTRVQRCGEPQARQRLAQAKSFLEVAEVTADENDPTLEFLGISASQLRRSLRQAAHLVDFAERVATR